LVNFNAKLRVLSIELKDKIGNARYVAEPVKAIHLYSNKTYEPEVNGSAKAVNFLMIIAVFILVIAWVNYINLSTARAIERAREVGIRKVMGSVRAQLVLQFLSESVIVNILAAGLALLLFQVLLPMFRDLTGQPLTLAYWQDPIFWFIFSGLLVAGALLSGLYPAVVLSSFQPAAVLKGKFRSSSHGQLLRRSLVIFQFASTVVLVIGMVTVYRQVNYLRTYDLGMNIAQTLVVRAPSTGGADSLFHSAFQTLKTELLRNPEIKRVARSESLPGLSLHELSSTMFTRVGQESANGSYEYYHFSVDADFMPALDMKLVAGRSFESGKLNQDQIIINEEAANRLGFGTPEEAIGAKVTYKTRWGGDPSTIIGVMRNFYQRSPKEKHIPMVFRYGEGASYFSIRLNSNDLHETVAAVKNTWGTVFPNSVFHYFFLDEKYDQQYQSDGKFGQIIATFSGLAVLIACLGLFGLSSYTIVQRTKEIGIRKVLGASVTQIVTLLTGDFARVVLLASVLALPVAWFGIEQWLSGYAVRVSPNVWVFLLPVVLILAIALLTVSFQTVKTAVANPTESLKQE
jgi:putative ABC transport system permease protein